MPSLKHRESLKQIALLHLRAAVGSGDADFRDGQWESIYQAVMGNRVLVVQRTGWGKTMVYTISTKLRREQGAGPSLMISPLLALMRNQEDAAFALGLNARRMTGDNHGEWKKIHEELQDDKVDILMITPERLGSNMFLTKTLPIIASGIGMLIIDEAHCISDWGHDFRPDYLRIRRIQQMIPQGSSVVATTATANNRVVEDIKHQLGDNIQVTRGSLIRRSLQLHNFKMPEPSTRLAWMAWAIPEHLPGSGIVYVLTRKDADLVTKWLQYKKIDAHAYYGGTEEREHLEKELQNNNIKVLVATIALGMGFDKPDLSFIIHYQRPSSVVHYYQQVGRAGRGITDAYGFLMWGEEDERIADYFLDNAFPSQTEIDLVMNALEEADSGLKLKEIMFQVNLKKSRIEKVLSLASLESPAPVINERGIWYATGETDGFQIPPERIERLRKIRSDEKAQMRQYMNHDGCLMSFLQHALDDPSAESCGRCRNCIDRRDMNYLPKSEKINEAQQFLGKKLNQIFVHKKWPIADLSDHPIHATTKIIEKYQASWGFALCRMFDSDLGHQIMRERTSGQNYSDGVIEAFATLLKNRKIMPSYVTYIPSISRQRQIQFLAQKVADHLGLSLIHAVSRTPNGSRQSDMKNPILRARNVANAFVIDQPCRAPTLLIDDITTSGWTFATVAALLRYDDCPKVIPAALMIHTLSD
ncbi:MAG: RecQ family ATP-dependent DNA helicase [Bacteroidetes bacterium]|nr:RecQ family ATP-dependent DNA helicase [Bacteroidota bacterium]